jgi:hypothetical protein
MTIGSTKENLTMRKMLAHTRPPLERYYACILLGRIAIGDWLTCAIGVVSLAILFRWKVSNPLLIAATAVVQVGFRVFGQIS